jgi:hypothetical protein
MSELQHHTIPREDPPRLKCRAILALQEVMLCLNIACAVGYVLLAYIYKNYAQERAANDSTYYFIRSAFKINDLFHIKSLSSVNPDAVARQFQFRWNQVGYDLLALVTVLCVAALLLLFLRLASDSASHRKSLSRVAGLVSIFAAPLCYLYLAQFNPAWRIESFLFPALMFLRNPASIAAAVELFCVPIVLVLFRNHRMPRILLVIFVSVHCLFWALVPWPAVPLFLWVLYTPYLFVAILALSGIVWLLLSLDTRPDQPEILVKRRAGKWTVGVALVAVVTMCLLWFPTASHSLIHPKNLDSLKIEMSRGPCFGDCIVYTLTILGDGHVVLVQQHNRHFPDRGPQEKSITSDQISQILESLDHADFFALEDRAFSWCFDAPSVGISVSLDGRTKRVVSDTYCTDSNTGVQARFVDAASEIDRIVGSDQLLMCEFGPCRM